MDLGRSENERNRREKEYEKRRSRSRSQERESSRYRERSRSRERRRDGNRYTSSRRRDDRDRERYCDRDRYRDRDYREKERWDEERDERQSDEYRRSEVNRDDDERCGPIIMLRNLKDSVRKEDISRAVGTFMSYVQDIRLVQKRESWKDPGSLGFAFLEFYDAKDARRWVELNKDDFQIHGGLVDVEYSHHRKLSDGRSQYEERDWSCFKCGTLNFARRRICMTCDCPRTESDSLHEDVREGRLSASSAEEQRLEGEKEERNPPSNVLILRGLDALSNEDSVRSAIERVSSCEMKDVRLIRDKATNTSRGFCFVETNSIEDATKLMETLHNQYPAFFVEGRRLTINFARQMNPGPKSTNSGVASAAIAQAEWSMGTMKGGVGRQRQLQNKNNSTQPQSYNHQGNTAGNTQSGVQTSSQSYSVASDTKTGKENEQETQQQLPSTYTYDQSSGFYYDSASGLYYDPNTKYHYNSQTGYYCYFDPAKQTYVSVDKDGNVVPSESTDTTTTSTTTSTAKESGKKKKEGGVATASTLCAKKIAKNMERWAKSVNAAKSVQQQQMQTVITMEKAESQTSTPAMQQTESISFTTSIEPRRTGIALSSAFVETETDKASLSTHAVDTSESSSDQPYPKGADMNPAHTDWNQLACLLCKRKFPSRDVLVKHQQLSDLHKQNLQKERQGQANQSAFIDLKYRDRAKERRDKYGSPAIVPGWKKRLEREMAKDPGPPIPYEEPTKEGIKEDNIGNKMLQAMGWSEGEGLGKASQGIVEPIKAEMRHSSAGLGAPGSKYLYSSAGSYKDTLKQLTKARYEETFK